MKESFDFSSRRTHCPGPDKPEIRGGASPNAIIPLVLALLGFLFLVAIFWGMVSGNESSLLQ